MTENLPPDLKEHVIESKGTQEIKAILDAAEELGKKVGDLFEPVNAIACAMVIQAYGKVCCETYPAEWQTALKLRKALEEQIKKNEIVMP